MVCRAMGRLIPIKALIGLWLVTGQAAKAVELNVTVGFSYFPPWQIARNATFVGGIDYQVLAALQNELAQSHDIHLNFNYYYCPLKRCLMMMQTGQIDLKTGLLHRPEREEYIHFIVPTYQEYVNKAFYIRTNAAYEIKDYEDLSNLSVGLSRASVNFPRFDRDTDLTKVEVSGTYKGLQMLVAGRFDAFIGTELVTDYVIQQRKFSTYIRKAPYKYKKRNPGFFGVSKTSELAHYLPQLSLAMRKIVENGLVDHAIEQYLSGS